jgi:hypothetical protein
MIVKAVDNEGMKIQRRLNCIFFSFVLVIKQEAQKSKASDALKSQIQKLQAELRQMSQDNLKILKLREMPSKFLDDTHLFHQIMQVSDVKPSSSCPAATI